MEHLKAKITRLELQNILSDPKNKNEMYKYQIDLDQMEQQLQGIEQFLDSELEELEKGKLLLKSLEKQKEVLKSIIQCLPKQVAPVEVPVVEEVKAPKVKVQKIQANEMVTRIAPVTAQEFKNIPAYALSRMTIQKLNQHINELNQFFKDKYTILNMVPQKMTKWQRDVVMEHKESNTAETFGCAFVTEKEIREKQQWTKSQFAYNAVGRNVIAILRSLGRIKEVRGGGQNRICLI